MSDGKPYVIIADDEPNMGKALTKVLALQGIEAESFESPIAALEAARRRTPAVVLSDVRMPEMTGEVLIETIRAEKIPCDVIMMTGYGTVESAMRCVRAGALDYVTKPFDTKALVALVQGAIEKRRAPAPVKPAGEFVAADDERRLVGESAAMKAIRALIVKVAPSGSPVLICGESGTGKELAARAIHRNSPRAGQPFVAINCASIPENLMESELFGHERGAFTGAEGAKVGLMEVASGGTLFLDEIGEMPFRLQAKLLRALQEGEITRVGSVRAIRVDLRILAATNRDLAESVRTGGFREDLFYRLNVLRIVMPPLRDRPEDVEVLAEHFLALFRERFRRPGLAFDPGMAARLRSHSWPGNIRELRNTIERLVVLSEGDTLTADAWESGELAASAATPVPSAGAYENGSIPEFRDARDRFEADYLRAVLQACDGNVTEAARRSGMSRRNFYDKIDKLKIDTGEFKERG